MNKDAKIAILGYGAEGKAAEAYLKTHGFTDLTVLDEKDDPKAFENLDEFKHIFRSPGVPLHRFDNYKDKLTSVTKYFFEHCPCPVIGVTGTKGKGTTSTLITNILKNAGHDVYLGGNIGDPAINFLDKLTPESLVVLELSSFQLEDLTQSPHIAVVLNTSSEHLDVHPTTEDYRKAKEPIVKFQGASDYVIVNGDYEGSSAFAKLGAGEKFYVSRRDKVEGGFIDGDKIMILGQQVATIKDIALLGDHNQENVLPACLVAKLLEVSDEIIQKTLREFTGLPNRLEFVTEKNGIKYYNDTFSSTPETSIAGLQAFDEPLYLIAGGSSKNSDFTEWGQVCAAAKNLKKVLLIGQTAPVLQEALPDSVPTEHVGTMEKAFELVEKEGEPGDILLLSPGCASFDQFDNYKHRGEVFKKLAS